MSFDYHMPTHLYFGPGALEHLADIALPGRKALLVTSAGGSMERLGYLKRVQDLLAKQQITTVTFNKILANPIKDHVMEGAAVAKANGCNMIIGLGGGSSIDSAKSIAIMCTNPGDYWDYIKGGSGKNQPLVNAPLPIIAITTTAGTGTEADPWTVITKPETAEKIGFGTEQTFPCVAIVDPELMLSLPPHLTAYQGFDALFHAMEGYIAQCATPLSDLYALEAITLIAQYLPAAVADGQNLEARTQLALANTLAGMVESASSCTSQHALEHALSGKHPDLPHGAGLIMLSASYFDFFADKLPERFLDMARALGASEPTDPQECLTRLLALQKICGVDALKMSDYGIDPEHFDDYAVNAIHTMGGLFAVDRYNLDFDETIYILQQAYR